MVPKSMLLLLHLAFDPMMSLVLLGRRKHLKTSLAVGMVNGYGIELMVFKRTHVNVNKIDHTHGLRCANKY